MPKSIPAATLLVLSIGCASIQPPTEASVRAAEDDWNRSRMAGDAHRVAELLDDDWTDIHVDGRVEHKNTYVEGIASGDRHILAIDVIDRTIRIEGSVAIVSGEVVQRGFRRGEMREGRLRYTHIWVRSGSSWHLIRSQSTELKPQ